MTRLQHTTFTLTRRRPGQQEPEYGWGCNGCGKPQYGYADSETALAAALEHEKQPNQAA